MIRGFNPETGSKENERLVSVKDWRRRETDIRKI